MRLTHNLLGILRAQHHNFMTVVGGRAFHSVNAL